MTSWGPHPGRSCALARGHRKKGPVPSGTLPSLSHVPSVGQLCTGSPTRVAQILASVELPPVSHQPWPPLVSAIRGGVHRAVV